MRSPPDVEDGSVDAAAANAASWFARLNAETVSIQDLTAFQVWRRQDHNDDAYREVESMWGRGEAFRADPEIARTLAATLASARPVGRSRMLGIGFAAATVLLAIAVGVWAEARGFLSERTYQTAVGQQQEVALPDGSAIRLDTDTRFSRSERHLALLCGRAFFAVAHDTRRPFIVVAGDTRVRAVGTRFSVRRDLGDVQVVLVQGAVTVTSRATGSQSKPAWTLRAGQQLIADGGPSIPAAVDVATATGWLQSRLIFRELPLRDAIAAVNRYTADKVVLYTPDAGGRWSAVSSTQATHRVRRGRRGRVWFGGASTFRWRIAAEPQRRGASGLK